MLVALGVNVENIVVTDIKGVVYKGRIEEMDDNRMLCCGYKGSHAGARLSKAQIYSWVFAGGVLKPTW
jgi:malate dehydrogenase (oxaloacetate-decarboxylating)(NADP+)